MATIDLPYVQRFKDRHGKVRHYFRRPGFKRRALPGTPGSEEFMEAYRAAMAEKRAVAAGKSPPGSISALIVAYYQSSDFKERLQPSTQHVYRNVLDRFRDEHGDKPAKRLEARHIRQMLDAKADKPGAASNLLKRLRGLFAFAVERGLVPSDPTVGVKFRRKKTEGFTPWSEEDIAKFEAHWPRGSKPRLALDLLLYLGVRRSDVVKLGHQHRRDGYIRFKPTKGGAGAPTLAIRLHPYLAEVLDALPGTEMTFLLTAFGKPFVAAGFTNWFVEQAQAAGLPEGRTPHGLRKAACRRLAEAGCSALEIASITGHASLKEVERYTRSADQQRLSDNAIARLNTAQKV